jgi:hypothetical protein
MQLAILAWLEDALGGADVPPPDADAGGVV